MTFNGTSNISLVNCTFQHSIVQAVCFVMVSGNIIVNHSNFLSNKGALRSHCGALNVSSGYNFVHLIISESDFYSNGLYCTLGVVDDTGLTIWNITMAKIKFSSNIGGVLFEITGTSSFQLEKLNFNDNEASNSSVAGMSFLLYGNSSLLVSNSLFTNNIGGALWWIIKGELEAEILLSNSNFTNTRYLEVDDINTVSTYVCTAGGAVYIQYSVSAINNYLVIEECEFFNNTSHHGVALYIQSYSDFSQRNTFVILNSKIYHNTADDSVVYIDFKSPHYIVVRSSSFTENIGSSMHLLQCDLQCENVVFADNIADNGAALYIDRGSYATFDDGGIVEFINNSAVEYGGAIYIHLVYDCYSSPFSYNHYNYSEVLFVNNTAEISGNSLYFYFPMNCVMETNISDPDCILYIPCLFNYSQPVNGKMMNIPCDLDYTLLNGTGAPIFTSPHELRLYFPFNDGYNISSTSDHNVYFVRNNILGLPVKFTGEVFDYFGRSAEPTQFNVKCIDSTSSTVLPKVNFLIDNVTSLSVTFSGENVEKRINVTVKLISALRSIKEISTTLIIELLPCSDHPGYTYSAARSACVCYHHNVECYDNYTEIKRGYWFGSVMSTTTTTFCPHYCRITGRKEIRQGYFELPNTVNAQCNDHRVGKIVGNAVQDTLYHMTPLIVSV